MDQYLELLTLCVILYLKPARIHFGGPTVPMFTSHDVTLGYPRGIRCRIVLIYNSVTKCQVIETKMYRHFDRRISDKSFVMDISAPCTEDIVVGTLRVFLLIVHLA